MTTGEMSKITMLFIRACKASNYSKLRTRDARIASVYKKFYLNDVAPKNVLIAILADIVEDFDLLTVTNLLTRLDPEYVFRADEVYNYIDRCYDTLVSAVRYAPVTKFPELIHPRRFRNA